MVLAPVSSGLATNDFRACKVANSLLCKIVSQVLFGDVHCLSARLFELIIFAVNILTYKVSAGDAAASSVINSHAVAVFNG